MCVRDERNKKLGLTILWWQSLLSTHFSCIHYCGHSQYNYVTGRVLMNSLESSHMCVQYIPGSLFLYMVLCNFGARRSTARTWSVSYVVHVYTSKQHALCIMYACEAAVCSLLRYKHDHAIGSSPQSYIHVICKWHCQSEPLVPVGECIRIPLTPHPLATGLFTKPVPVGSPDGRLRGRHGCRRPDFHHRGRGRGRGRGCASSTFLLVLQHLRRYVQHTQSCTVEAGVPLRNNYSQILPFFSPF